MNSNGIASLDHVSDGTVGSEPCQAVMVAPVMVVVMVVKVEMQHQREVQVGNLSW